jgi:predicted amidohydrolase
MKNMRNVVVAATQIGCSMNKTENIASAENLVRKAASKGAQIILLQELFETLDNETRPKRSADDHEDVRPPLDAFEINGG